MRVYIAYNAWYRRVTGKTNDYEAIKLLQTRFVIWDDYVSGSALVELRKVMTHIAVYTKNNPVSVESGAWSGVVKDSNDWKALISFWYEVRCGLFHGSSYAIDHTIEVRYAYESLYIFMDEIVKRMRGTFKLEDTRRLKELEILTTAHNSMTVARIAEQTRLQQKFILSPELWNVDMVHQRKE